MPYATRNVGRYEILRPLGRGGMASVHLARQVDLDRLVALKELRALRAEEPSVAQRFLRESRLAGGLSHPNIVTVFDYFEWDGTPFIAMEYVVGGALRPYVGTLSRPQIIGVCEDLLGGLAYAHRNGVVHRDIKPENLMVTSVGRVKIADFGIAKATDRIHTEGFRTSTGMTVGTPAYMAPEQAMAQDVGPWTDLYSVGCLVYELLVGAVPFADTDAPMAMLLRHINEPPRPVRAADPGVSSRLSDWVARLLAKVPSERTGSAEAAWDELEEIADDELGSRWRRSARLGDPASAAAEAGPGGSPASPGVAGPWTPPPAHAVPEPLASIESSLLGSADGEAPDTGTSFVTFVPPPPPGPPLPAPAAAVQVGTPAEAESAPTPQAPVAADERPPTGIATTAGPHTPPAEPEPAAPSPPRPRRRAALTGLLLVILGTAAYLGLHRGASQPTSAAHGPGGTTDLVTGPLAVRVPAGWARVPPATTVPGMKLSGAVAAAPGGKAARGAVVVGTLAAAQVGAGLLPPPVLRRVVPAGVAPLRVRVGQPASTGYRYDRVTTPDRATMSIVVVATSAGVATVECLAGSAANSAVPPACDGIFASLSIRGVRRFAPGPSNAYRDAVTRELAVLGHAVSRGDLAMRGTAAKRQAAGAMTVARALQRAGEVVSGLVVSPGDWHFQRELTRSFAAGKQGYLRLATAARRADAPGHARAVTAIRHAFAAVDSALVDMARAGYPRLLLAAPALPALTRERHHASSPGTAVVTPPAAGHALTPAASPTPAPPVVHPTPVPTPVVPRPTPITGGSG